MKPQPPCCHTPQGPARGQVGPGTMRVPSPPEPRDRGLTWGQTVAATTGTPCDRLRTTAELVPTVRTLRCHGGPLQALVAAFGLEARTVAAGLARAGQPGQQRPQHGVQPGPVARPHVQAEERWVQRVGRRGWRARALAVPSRRWLGGVLSPPRDWPLSPMLGPLVRSCAGSRAPLVGVDGLARDGPACRRVGRHPGRPGCRGRPQRVLEDGGRLGQRVQRYARRRGVSVERRVVRGTEPAIAAVLAAPPPGPGLNPASIERLTATFRASRAPLVRRGRAIAHSEALLTAGMGREGCAYPFCWRPDRLRLRAPAGACWQWQERPPAMAAGLTHQRWPLRAWLSSQGPLPAWVAPTRRGRPPKRALHPAMAVAA
jgi:hypothetical protein